MNGRGNRSIAWVIRRSPFSILVLLSWLAFLALVLATGPPSPVAGLLRVIAVPAYGASLALAILTRGALGGFSAPAAALVTLLLAWAADRYLRAWAEDRP